MTELYPEPKKIKLGDKEIEVKKLPFKRFMKVSGIFSTLKQENGELKFETREDYEGAADKLIEIFSTAFDLETQWLEDNLQMSDVPMLIKEIMEANKLPFGQKQEAAAK